MWAQKLEAPRRFTTVEVPAPTTADVGPGQVLLRVLAGGLCGSDLPAFKGRSTVMPADTGATAPGIVGYPMHEVVGRVVHSRHPDVGVGETVVGWASGFDAIAEYCVTDGTGVVPHRGQLPPTAAIMLQPLACVLWAAEQADVRDRSVAVIGLGPIGLLFAHVLRARGARRVVGVDPVDRSDVAGRFGIDEAVRASSDRWAAQLTDGDRPEVVVEAVGHTVSTFTDSITAVARNGQVYCFGIPDDPVYPLPMKEFLRKNLTLRSGVTEDRQRVLREAGDYLAAHGELAEGYVSHTHPADQVQRAFTDAATPQPGQLKITLDMED